MQTPEDILNANRLIFPGVGAFAAAMDVLTKNGQVFSHFCNLYYVYASTKSGSIMRGLIITTKI